MVLLSATLALAVLLGARRLARGRRQWTGALIGLGIWWLFVWLSPQVYYQLYLLLFDDLPYQVVVGAPPGPGRLATLLFFLAPASLSNHAVGLLGWAAILAGGLTGLRARPRG